MMQQTSFKCSYTCGRHVAGHGRQISALGEATPWRNNCVYGKGVIVMLPGKSDEPCTVLIEQTFIVLEAKEEHRTPLLYSRQLVGQFAEPTTKLTAQVSGSHWQWDGTGRWI